MRAQRPDFESESRSNSRPRELSGPISRDITILSLRYPMLRDTFSGRSVAPQSGAIPRSWYLVSHRNLCDISFCNISCDKCAIHHKNEHERVLRYYRYKYQERRISLKREFWGRTSRGHPGSFTRCIPGPKLLSGAVKILEKNKHFGADIHDPKARTSTTLTDFQKFRSEKLRAESIVGYGTYCCWAPKPARF